MGSHSFYQVFSWRGRFFPFYFALFLFCDRCANALSVMHVFATSFMVWVYRWYCNVQIRDWGNGEQPISFGVQGWGDFYDGYGFVDPYLDELCPIFNSWGK